MNEATHPDLRFRRLVESGVDTDQARETIEATWDDDGDDLIPQRLTEDDQRLLERLLGAERPAA